MSKNEKVVVPNDVPVIQELPLNFGICEHEGCLEQADWQSLSGECFCDKHVIEIIEGDGDY